MISRLRKHAALVLSNIHLMFLIWLTLSIDLVFTFVDELLADQTPESVHLMQSGK